MKSALSDTLVICDMDNTLLTAKEGLPACNRTVINLFTSLGGLFTVAPGRPPEDAADADPETGLIPLGDMVISLERARAQGEEYGHGTEREVAYLAVHSVLHLLGYDHMDDGPEKARMREREEAILGALGISRRQM